MSGFVPVDGSMEAVVSVDLFVSSQVFPVSPEYRLLSLYHIGTRLSRSLDHSSLFFLVSEPNFISLLQLSSSQNTI
jgi:hypothetical protein